MREKSLWLVSLCFLFAVSAFAQNNGSAANGDFQFSLNGASGAIQFDARLQGNGAKGQMTFNANVEVSNEDVDGEGITSSAVSQVTATVKFDCMHVSANRAAMSGLVTSSNIPSFVGRRAVLSVEDNGEGIDAPVLDRFTWGLYKQNVRNWTPSDSEVPGDNGAMLNWFATDSERPDDVAIPARQSEEIDCHSFPFGSYAFETIAQGAGNIQVKP
jgi:hypothetical protein